MTPGKGQSLTGVWQGRYQYPAKLAPVSFVATLIETGRSVTGTTHEDASSIGTEGLTAYAMLAGRRDGNNLNFVKTYDDDGATATQPIEYEGVINADATEINGTWIIFGVWGGTFQMIRSSGSAAKTTRQVSAVLR